MKKIIMAGAMTLSIIGFCTTQSKAQVGNVTATINLLDIITVTASVPVLTYTLTAASFAADVETTIPGNLTVLSTRAWDLDVKASTANFTFLTDNIPVSVLAVETVPATLGGTHTPVASMSSTDQKLIDEATSAVAALVGMKYTLKTNSNASAFNVPTGAYIATIVYTGSID